MTSSTHQLRRGLPRVPGGEPWPAAGTFAPVTGSACSPAATPMPKPEQVAAVTPTRREPAPQSLRRGLPRAPGGEPWPAVGATSISVPKIEATTTTMAIGDRLDNVVATRSDTRKPPLDPALAEEVPVAASTTITNPASEDDASSGSDWFESSARVARPASIARTFRGRTLARWAGLGAISALGLIAVAGVIVLAARGVTTLPGVPEFLERYPGEYDSAVLVEAGFPAWVRWTHFLNFFFLVLIVRSGLLVRHQQQPPAFYAPKGGGKKVSIYLWLHTSLDLLWLANGIIFISLLFLTGHWVRIVPTSWEVFPNAMSALLQYLTLEWPVEHGWVNYNSLQQLMYFAIVFIAAPLAVVTGIRMSEWWPKCSEKLNRCYPAAVARAIHYPTMLFFVAFVIVHVVLVFATGALQNLNHMFAGTHHVSWAGFWWFASGLVITVAGVAGTRPLLLAPIARVTGRVSRR